MCMGRHVKVNYSDDAMKDALTKERTFKEFFLTKDALLRTKGSCHHHTHHLCDHIILMLSLVCWYVDIGSLTTSAQKWDAIDRRLHISLQTAEDSVRARLLENFDYPTAMAALLTLVSEANKYMAPARTGEVQTIVIKV